MIKAFKQYAALPLLLLLAFYLDGALPLIFVPLTADSGYRMDAAISLLVIVYLAEHLAGHQLKVLYITSTVIGALFDLYYNQILGIHLFIWPLLAYLTRQLQRWIHRHFYSEWLWMIASYVLYTHGLYFLYRLLGLNFFAYGEFFINRFVPSLILNAFLAFIVIAVLRYFTKWLMTDK